MDGQLIKMMVGRFLTGLSEGKTSIPVDLVTEFTTNLHTTFLTDWERANEGKFTLRMSNLGRPLCQTQMEKEGAPTSPVFNNLKPVRFATGDMLEHWLIMILKASGVPVDATDIPCSLEIFGENITGTADIIIDGKVYDIKSASSFSVSRKWNWGFQALVEDDPFGYITQGYCYSEALKKPFGGWLVINKNNGELLIIEPPTDDTQHRKEALRQAQHTVKTIVENGKFQRQYDVIEEMFRKKPTGNTILPFTCSWCDYRESCWENLQYRPSVMSKAVDPKWVYYVDLKVIPERGE